MKYRHLGKADTQGTGPKNAVARGCFTPIPATQMLVFSLN